MNFKNERLMMSKEEARNRAKELLNENQVDLITKYMFLEQQYKKQKEVIDKARECIKKFLCTEEYINVNAIAIADNYSEVLEILDEVE